MNNNIDRIIIVKENSGSNLYDFIFLNNNFVEIINKANSL
mgnify:CR=1 FL=1